MSADGKRHIVAGGGQFKFNAAGVYEMSPLVEYMLDLTGKDHPRVCILNTALGDDPRLYVACYAAFSGTRVVPSHLALFPMPNVLDPRQHLLSQDVVIVGGGSVANEVAVWRTHGLDLAFREAWERGIVLGGVSAGAICWFEAGTTDSFGKDLRPFTAGLGLLSGSYCPHYDSEERRRPTMHRLVGDGSIPAGWAADDRVAMHFVDDELSEVVTDRTDGASAFRIDRDSSGNVTEAPVDTRVLAS
ncbi:MAG: peptidase E [Actinobacteria bacterium]|nr:peptidase E [Actinomycetota bacterium]